MSRQLLIIVLIMFTNFQLSFAAVMRHNLRDIATYDIEDMQRLVNKEINVKEKNDNVFYDQAAQVLAQTVLVQSRFAEREAGLSRLKSKMLQEEFIEVVKRGANMLIALLQDKNVAPSDQASALVALTNLVIEARHLPMEDMKPTLEKIVQADIQISDEARAYGREPLKNLVSPSEEAKKSIEK